MTKTLCNFVHGPHDGTTKEVDDIVNIVAMGDEKPRAVYYRTDKTTFTFKDAVPLEKRPGKIT